MTYPRPDEALVALVALGSVFWITSILRRGLSQGRLPLGRSRIERGERKGAFQMLFVLYVLAALAMIFIGLDLLFGLTSGRSPL